MQPATFEYHRPQTIEEALQLLAGDDVRVLAGGHSLLPLMKLRVSSPGTLVDIGKVPGLAGIERQGDRIRIGAMTTHAAVAASQDLAAGCPLLAETAAQIGDLQVRNRGTIGGSLAHADPAADYPAALLALEGTVTARGREGEREIPASELFMDVFTTSLRAGELITSVTVPVTGDLGSAYLKHRHPASSYAVVGVAALVGLKRGKCSEVRLAIGGVSGTPLRVTAAEEALTGEQPTEENLTRAAAEVKEAITEPIGDLYASAEYRVHLASVMARRALARATERAS